MFYSDTVHIAHELIREAVTDSLISLDTIRDLDGHELYLIQFFVTNAGYGVISCDEVEFVEDIDETCELLVNSDLLWEAVIGTLDRDHRIGAENLMPVTLQEHNINRKIWGDQWYK